MIYIPRQIKGFGIDATNVEQLKLLTTISSNRIQNPINL